MIPENTRENDDRRPSWTPAVEEARWTQWQRNVESSLGRSPDRQVQHAAETPTVPEKPTPLSVSARDVINNTGPLIQSKTAADQLRGTAGFTADKLSHAVDRFDSIAESIPGQVAVELVDKLADKVPRWGRYLEGVEVRPVVDLAQTYARSGSVYLGALAEKLKRYEAPEDPLIR